MVKKRIRLAGNVNGSTSITQKIAEEKSQRLNKFSLRWFVFFYSATTNSWGACGCESGGFKSVAFDVANLCGKHFSPRGDTKTRESNECNFSRSNPPPSSLPLLPCNALIGGLRMWANFVLPSLGQFFMAFADVSSFIIKTNESKNEQASQAAA